MLKFDFTIFYAIFLTVFFKHFDLLIIYLSFHIFQHNMTFFFFKTHALWMRSSGTGETYWLWGEDWPPLPWLKTAMVCPPAVCIVKGCSRGTCVDASFSPTPLRAVSSSFRLKDTWETHSWVKALQTSHINNQLFDSSNRVNHDDVRRLYWSQWGSLFNE